MYRYSQYMFQVVFCFSSIDISHGSVATRLTCCWVLYSALLQIFC